jgi:hypothetical protein
MAVTLFLKANHHHQLAAVEISPRCRSFSIQSLVFRLQPLGTLFSKDPILPRESLLPPSL